MNTIATPVRAEPMTFIDTKLPTGISRIYDANGRLLVGHVDDETAALLVQIVNAIVHISQLTSDDYEYAPDIAKAALIFTATQ